MKDTPTYVSEWKWNGCWNASADSESHIHHRRLIARVMQGNLLMIVMSRIAVYSEVTGVIINACILIGQRLYSIVFTIGFAW